jgi:preprotein translocase subunit SecE
MNLLTVFLIVFGIIAVVGLFIVLFDKGLRRRG